MSWLSVLLGKLGRVEKETAQNEALLAAQSATLRFVAYAKTKEYEALYELVARLAQDHEMSGAEKMARVLASATRDVKTWGEFFIKGVVEQVLGELSSNDGTAP